MVTRVVAAAHAATGVMSCKASVLRVCLHPRLVTFPWLRERPLLGAGILVEHARSHVPPLPVVHAGLAELLPEHCLLGQGSVHA